jgi:hypothetical protein
LGIVAFVFGLLGVIFGLVGAGLTLAIITAFVGVPFLLLGLIFLVAALLIGRRRYHRARQVVKVLRVGESTQGQIVDVHQDYAVRVNRRHPWVIRYQFRVNGQDYKGDVRTLNPVGASMQTGTPVCILYLPDAPQWNSIYPHP